MIGEWLAQMIIPCIGEYDIWILEASFFRLAVRMIFWRFSDILGPLVHLPHFWDPAYISLASVLWLPIASRTLIRR